ncbi:MAG: CorA family divalent cation transporter, partial [Methanobacteriota archaeon]
MMTGAPEPTPHGPHPEARPSPSPRAIPGTGGEETHGFCVALLRTGKPARVYGDSPSTFIPTLQESSLAWVNFAVKDMQKEGEMIATLLGFSGSIVGQLLSERLSAYEDLDTELGLLLPVVKVKGLDVEALPLIILVRQGLVLTIHQEEKVTRLAKFARYADTFMRKIPGDLPVVDRQTILLTRIINENNDRNFDGLRTIEEQGELLNRFLIDPEAPATELGPEIYRMKTALIQYLDSLWATLTVIQSLRWGDAEMITDDSQLLARIGIMGDEVNRHIQLSEHMSNVLASGLEVLQSIYNNQLQRLNNKLAFAVAIMTILGTAVLVPNTLATILSNPAFAMERADVAWYTALLVASTIV